MWLTSVYPIKLNRDTFTINRLTWAAIALRVNVYVGFMRLYMWRGEFDFKPMEVF